MEKGQVLRDRYRVLERLGRGGMGAVYEALDLRTGARVAVKVITATEMSDEAGGRFEREVRAAAKVQSPHVVRMFDSGNDPATAVGSAASAPAIRPSSNAQSSAVRASGPTVSSDCDSGIA